MKKNYTLIIGILFSIFLFTTVSNAAQTNINGPAGSGSFGQIVTALPNGNIVVTDPFYDIPAGAANVGAVYLYNGATLALISTLTGSTAGDTVGSNGVTVLTNGNYVVRSSSWDNGAIVDAGAVTWCNQNTGCSGTVSAANSLVGSTTEDTVGNSGVIALTNGNYVVSSASWDNGAIVNAGAATWGNGTSGTSGVVSSANSLVGSTAGDIVGNSGVAALTNGNYVVRSQSWDNGAITNVGAVTWGNGTTGISGTISAANSLIGAAAGDQVGNSGVTALTNGNYVVRSSILDNGATADVGAVTWGNGTTGSSGVVSVANSLIGSAAGDSVGNSGVTALTNGNYVVRSGNWDNGAILGAGAATWGDGTTGISGTISAANSLIGSTSGDFVSSSSVTALPNGNYVVNSSNWDNGAIIDAGAISYLSGLTGMIPPPALEKGVSKDVFSNDGGGSSDLTVSMTNSVLGTTANGGSSMNFSFDAVNNRIVVGRPFDNIVTVFELTPTAANVSISGKVLTANGAGIRNAVVYLTKPSGETLTARTSSFGYYAFEDLEAGETYILSVASKRFTFTPQIVTATENLSEVDFTALE